MPGAANGVSNDKAIGERAVIVAALRAHGEEVVATAGEDGVFAVNQAEKDGIVGEGVEGSSLFQIGFGCIGHFWRGLGVWMKGRWYRIWRLGGKVGWESRRLQSRSVDKQIACTSSLGGVGSKPSGLKARATG